MGHDRDSPPSEWADATSAGRDVYYRTGATQADIIVWHWCTSTRMDRPRWLGQGVPLHQVVKLDPLHLEPSLECADAPKCGWHGFLRGGIWTPVVTYPATKTYWLERTDRVELRLRRYVSRGELGEHYHNASIWFEECRARYSDDRHATGSMCDEDVPPHGDPRWPTDCEAGDGYEFTPDDEWQLAWHSMWRRADTGELVSLRDAPPGASWDAFWLHEVWPRPDGISLMVKLQNGHHWSVDSEASNCTRKGEQHECWVRHGDPRECQVTVDKNSPNTCAAGGGSILAGDYHGFLQNGVLTEG